MARYPSVKNGWQRSQNENVFYIQSRGYLIGCFHTLTLEFRVKNHIDKSEHVGHAKNHRDAMHTVIVLMEEERRKLKTSNKHQDQLFPLCKT